MFQSRRYCISSLVDEAGRAKVAKRKAHHEALAPVRCDLLYIAIWRLSFPHFQSASKIRPLHYCSIFTYMRFSTRMTGGFLCQMARHTFYNESSTRKVRAVGKVLTMPLRHLLEVHSRWHVAPLPYLACVPWVTSRLALSSTILHQHDRSTHIVDTYHIQNYRIMACVVQGMI
jgi:hypothetical protein